ncbi:hypothetical protein CTAYLR_010085 [Chrysophaeum taylorii]|uniref:Atg6 BARA domain-containing protein n=1 Tax=Chrysophaeum taylorii TaxID=2483200 RepID=A0AAD7XGX1_9STRA|nr:hypothetical protein CTAYLR_010085 [Chrysophaeum taylorii]
MESECAKLKAELRCAKRRRSVIRRRRTYVLALRQRWISECQSMEWRSLRLGERHDMFRAMIDHRISSFERLLALNSLDDCFHIWHCGPYATINSFRLGRLSSAQVLWSEVNAALGTVLHLLAVLNTKQSKFQLIPLGSYSRIQARDQKTSYSLFMDDSFSLLPKRNFTHALLALIASLEELKQLIKPKDPAMCQLYSLPKHQLQDRAFYMGDDNVWSKVMKFVLVDLKWAVAFEARHGATYAF